MKKRKTMGILRTFKSFKKKCKQIQTILNSGMYLPSKLKIGSKVCLRELKFGAFPTLLVTGPDSYDEFSIPVRAVNRLMH